MYCPKCHNKTKVIETRQTENDTRRLRECLGCGTHFASMETILREVSTDIPNRRLATIRDEIIEERAKELAGEYLNMDKVVEEKARELAGQHLYDAVLKLVNSPLFPKP
jgi:transcriptional regulator NrdR family protein